MKFNEAVEDGLRRLLKLKAVVSRTSTETKKREQKKIRVRWYM